MRRREREMSVTESDRKIQRVATLGFTEPFQWEAREQMPALLPQTSKFPVGTSVRAKNGCKIEQDEDVIYARVGPFSSIRSLNGASLDCPRPL